jgi:CRISPR-associated protein Cas4
MDSTIRISNLNDFLFCPRSIYFHELYQPYHDQYFKELAQTKWSAAHETIDKQDYSSSKQILQWISVYSETYWLQGKIDLYHRDKYSLIERKRTIKKIYPWYIYQLYAQYLCLTEMWYEVQTMKLYSLTDNKPYPIPIPNSDDLKPFEELLAQYRQYSLDQLFSPNPIKCKSCIYHELCDKSLV